MSMMSTQALRKALFAGVLLLGVALVGINHLGQRSSSLLDVDAPGAVDTKNNWQQWYNAGAGFDPAAKPVTTWQIIRSNYPREPYYDQDAKDLYEIHPEYFETAKPLRDYRYQQREWN
ncbi:hypothetical protein GUITHDRAFT_132980 [Guillardia theta CCMP2712]|uniref:Uncharacterized protein n=2 Tax=Guillardia theta TaxID=55529 RepID=L1JYD7_GUITC|nr:hypothetical protein GUITHDRAFT_132980 [Guillardia theta CCMP2712]EKX53230.1 hypothetical protein GUITHDRAFT_132980 [Guillardia theta CCMP2712]|eukprot:XP_005840210.1 hypothetical protein GUITHDRAFT_132980 [Guillardia theta CCMP2712]